MSKEIKLLNKLLKIAEEDNTDNHCCYAKDLFAKYKYNLSTVQELAIQQGYKFTDLANIYPELPDANDHYILIKAQ